MDCEGKCFGSAVIRDGICVCSAGIQAGTLQSKCYNFSGLIPGPPSPSIVNSSWCLSPKYGPANGIILCLFASLLVLLVC